MKKQRSIAHFTHSEQQALHSIKNVIVSQLNPLLIYYIDSTYTYHSGRSSLPPRIKEQQWDFKARMLLIYDNNQQPDTLQEQQVHQSLADNLSLDMIAFSIDEMATQLTEYSLFFCWIYKRGIVLFERNGAVDRFTVPTFSIRAYADSVAEWYRHDAALATATTARLHPLPDKGDLSTTKAAELESIIIKNYGSLKLSIKVTE